MSQSPDPSQDPWSGFQGQGDEPEPTNWPLVAVGLLICGVGIFFLTASSMRFSQGGFFLIAGGVIIASGSQSLNLFGRYVAGVTAIFGVANVVFAAQLGIGQAVPTLVLGLVMSVLGGVAFRLLWLHSDD